MDPILEVKGLYKVFGEDTDRAFTMIDEGANKEEVFEKTGLTVHSHPSIEGWTSLLATR